MRGRLHAGCRAPPGQKHTRSRSPAHTALRRSRVRPGCWKASGPGRSHGSGSYGAAGAGAEARCTAAVPKGSEASVRAWVLRARGSAAPVSYLRSKGFSPSLPPAAHHHVHPLPKSQRLYETCRQPSARVCTEYSYFIIHPARIETSIVTKFGRFFHLLFTKSCAISGGSGLSAGMVFQFLPVIGSSTRMPSGSGVHTGTRKVCFAQCSACRPMRARLPP